MVASSSPHAAEIPNMTSSRVKATVVLFTETTRKYECDDRSDNSRRGDQMEDAADAGMCHGRVGRAILPAAGFQPALAA